MNQNQSAPMSIKNLNSYKTDKQIAARHSGSKTREGSVLIFERSPFHHNTNYFIIDILPYIKINYKSQRNNTRERECVCMVIRKLPPSVYHRLCRNLAAHAFALPLESCYTVGLVTDGTEYHLKLQPEGHCRMALLQALEVEREENGPNFLLLTQQEELNTLFNKVLEQGIPPFAP